MQAPQLGNGTIGPLRRWFKEGRCIGEFQGVADVEFGGIAQPAGLKGATAVTFDEHFPGKDLCGGDFAAGSGRHPDHEDAGIIFMRAHRQDQGGARLGGGLEAGVFRKAAPDDVARRG